MEEIREQMSAIEGPRHQSYVKYPLADILIIIMCAVLSGLDTLGDLAIYAKKENQPSLLEDVRLFFEDQSNKNEWESCQTVEKNAGRIEKQICRKIKDISWMKEHKSSGIPVPNSSWNLLASIGKLSLCIGFWMLLFLRMTAVSSVKMPISL